jgi:hypothetical protein
MLLENELILTDNPLTKVVNRLKNKQNEGALGLKISAIWTSGQKF